MKPGEGNTNLKQEMPGLGGGEEEEEGKWVFAVNMMFILVMYLTVEDNRELSVWLYEKNLNTNTKTFVDEHLREILLWKRFTFMKKK